MLYFQDSKKGLHFLSQEDIEAGFDSLLPSGCEEISDEAARAIQNPPLQLADATAQKMGELYAAYQAASRVDVTYETVAGVKQTFQADESSQSTLLVSTTGYNLVGATPEGFYWVARDNAQVPFTLEDLKGLYAVMLGQGKVAFDKLQTLKAAVRAATTAEAVLAINWA